MPSLRLRPRHFILPLILLIALAFRVWRLVDFPPGFHFDEAIDLKIALDVLGGARPLYVAEGWGREALYYYLVAPMLRLVEYNPLALRATAVLCGLGVIVAAHGLARRLHGQLAAWLTTAWLAVAMWPVWAARFGVRHIALALLLGLAAWAFWWAFGRIRDYELGIRNEEFLLAGALLGLTAYTYQPARFVPLLFGGFALYLLLFHRRPTAENRLWHNRRGWAVWALSAALVALPLVVIVARVTPIETGERAFSIEPLTELLAGNPRPVLDNLVAVAGVFTVSGDPLKSYNLPGRPLFVPRLTGLFFYAGLALAVWRWRRPAYAFVLLWLVVALLPTVVTISAPNFNRMVAAQFPIFFLAGLAAAEGIEWAAARGRPSPQPSPTGRGSKTAGTPSPFGRELGRGSAAAAALLVVAALGLTATATARDLFRVWPEQFADAHPLNREIAAVADFLEHRADGRPVVISSRDIEDEDPYIVSVSLDRAIDRRWVDSSQALALPAGADEAWLIVTADRWVDPLLADVVSLGAGEQGSLPPRPLEEGGGEGLPPRPLGEGGGEGLVVPAANPLQRVWFVSRGFQPGAAGGATRSTTRMASNNLFPLAWLRHIAAPTLDYAKAQLISLPPSAQIQQSPSMNQTAPVSNMFSLHLMTAASWPTLESPTISLPPESSFAPTYPIPFCACDPGAAAKPALWLTGVELGAAQPGAELTLLTSWQTGPARFLSLAMFVHLLDASGNIVAQDDGLGYPPHTWQPGDRFLQLARLPLPPDLPPGDYTLQFGLYDRATGARWPVLNADGQPAGDRLLLPLP